MKHDTCLDVAVIQDAGIRIDQPQPAECPNIP